MPTNTEGETNISPSIIISIITMTSPIITSNTNFFIYNITIIFIKKMKINFVNSKIITIFAVKI